MASTNIYACGQVESGSGQVILESGLAMWKGSSLESKLYWENLVFQLRLNAAVKLAQIHFDRVNSLMSLAYMLL